MVSRLSGRSVGIPSVTSRGLRGTGTRKCEKKDESCGKRDRERRNGLIKNAQEILSRVRNQEGSLKSTRY